MGCDQAIAGVSNAVGDIASGLIAANAAKKAAQAQEEAATRAQGLVSDYYSKSQGYQQPYYDIGTANMAQMNADVNAGKYNMPTESFSYQGYQEPQFNFSADPGYKFRLSQGTDAIQNSSAARGLGLSGATQKALARYGQNFASNEYGNAYNRYSMNRAFGKQAYDTDRNFSYQNFMDAYTRQNQQLTQQFGRQYTLAGMGNNAASTMSSNAMNAAGSIAGIIGQGGNARAAGIMGQGQAYGQMAGNLASGIGGAFQNQGNNNYGYAYGQSSPYNSGGGGGSYPSSMNGYQNASGQYPYADSGSSANSGNDFSGSGESESYA
jgi:hypothetical protein